MSNLESIKNRLMQEKQPQRMGHLAANLLRVANFVESGLVNEAKPIVTESKFMAEWIAPEVKLETQELLAEMQSFLALKEYQWLSWINDRKTVHTTASTIRAWSNELLGTSGLLS